MNDERPGKVPAVTLGFWAVKILATTLGETGGDAVSMSMGLGYGLGSLVFLACFAVAIAFQIRAVAFKPWLYWSTLVATTTVGTTLADLTTRSLGIGYAGGSALLALMLLLSFVAWSRTLGSIRLEAVNSARAERYYWWTIMLSQTLGTALGDWTADSAGLGYAGAALLFSLLLAAVAACHRWSTISRATLFWTAFVLTRPLGAVLGDFLDKAAEQGGLELSRYAASAALLGALICCLLVFPQRAARAHQGPAPPSRASPR